jgi:sugar lactone lactonase YvrE
MKRGLIACAVAGAIAAAGGASAGPKDSKSETGPFGFEPIPGSAEGDGSDFDPAAPWIIPAGFEQYIVSDESDIDIYLDPTIGSNSNDWHDMNTVNETGRHAGRYLYRTHEVRGNAERGGAVSVVDLLTGDHEVIAEDPTYDALDGIEWTPWGTILFAEETTGGRLLEIILDKENPMEAAAVVDRPAVGRLAHEGIAVGPDGSVYVVDEFRGELEAYGGGIYRFVPDRLGDLSSGNLYVLGVSGGPYGTGQGAWLGPIDPYSARVDGTSKGGTGYNRPEDVEIIGNTLYVAVTEGPRAGTGSQLFDGRVLAVDLQSLRVTDYVRPGLNVPIESSGVTGFDNPDNLAQTPDGKLVIVEDNVPSDIWIVDKDYGGDGVADDVSMFASLTDPGAEGTGIYFGKDPKTMFVNIQHSVIDDGDATWAITKID